MLDYDPERKRRLDNIFIKYKLRATVKKCQYCKESLIGNQRKNCDECSIKAKKLRNKNWHAANKNRTRKRNKRTHTTIAYKWNCLLSNAKRRNMVVLLSKEQFEIIIKSQCYYCNGILDNDQGWGSHCDRLDNNIGYTHENTVSCCGFCNKIKQDLLSPCETKEVIFLIIKMRKLDKNV